LNEDPVKILGLDFYSGSVQRAIEKILQGGLLMAPAAPGLAHNLNEDATYRTALQRADILLPDSGLMVLLWNRILPNGSRPIQRISGLEFLHEFLKSPITQKALENSSWIMPNEQESIMNQKWMENETGINIPPSNLYIAPHYPTTGEIDDKALVEQVAQCQSSIVLINIGGGTQERLGAYLRQQLSPTPAILCCGAAIAFLAGGQTSIPGWADKLKLGWFLRCLSNPGSYIPRYWKAKALIPLLIKHRHKLPPLSIKSSSTNQD